MGAQQVSSANDRNLEFESKQDALDDLFELLQAMNRAANMMSDEVPNIENKVRLPRNRSQQNLLAPARSLHADAAPYVANFIEFDLPADFVEDLQELIDTIVSFDSVVNTAEISRGESTGQWQKLYDRE